MFMTASSYGRTAKAALAALSIATGPAASATVEDFSSFWVLGDSLSDPGNLFAATSADPGLDPTPVSPPYFEGRFSNGPVWAEAVADAFGAAGRPTGNFAFGGAQAATDDDGIPDLGKQIEALAGASASALGDRPLAALWLGANDLFAGLADLRPGSAVTDALASIRMGFGQLGALGFEDVVLLNLPDLGETPRLNGTLADGPASVATRAFNDGLAAIAADSPLTVETIDIEALFDALLSDPSAFGVLDARTPCLSPGTVPCSPEEARQRAFFDTIHPNATIHEAVAAQAFAAIGALPASQPAPVPLPAGASLLLGAFALLGGARVATRRA